MRAWAWAGIAALLAGCPYQGRELGPGDVDGRQGDGGSAIDAAADAEVLGPFGTPTPISLAGAEEGDDDPSLTGDELELYFNATRGAPSADLWVATRGSTSDGWSLPRLVNELSSPDSETTPEVSTDGLTIYFSSTRPGGPGANDIWVSTRPTRLDPWGTPVVVAGLSSPFSEASPGTVDGLAIAFTTDSAGGTDIVAADRPDTQSPWSPWVAEDAINSGGHDGSPYLMPDHLQLYFDTDRDGPTRIYQVRRETQDALFPAPEPVPGLDGVTADDADPWLSPDGHHIVFWSNRGGTGQLFEAYR